MMKKGSWQTACLVSASLWGCELKCKTVIRVRSQRRQPPCEAVSWNTLLRMWLLLLIRQPPCEAVSWNCHHSKGRNDLFVSLLVRLWVEILCKLRLKFLESVSLLVRLWVEIADRMWIFRRRRSQPPCEAVSWNNLIGSLTSSAAGQPPCEAVSWNTDWSDCTTTSRSQPPCEAVSWNTGTPK